MWESCIWTPRRVVYNCAIASCFRARQCAHMISPIVPCACTYFLSSAPEAPRYQVPVPVGTGVGTVTTPVELS